ncbi:MAG: biotin/lipoyl-binding protein [Clostridiales bacterium]|nr:biotin/lipoyl-binding protein [Clostridiales bacterium]
MRNFVVTIDGKSYQVAVEEVGGGAAEVKNIAPAQEVKATAPVAKAAVPANGEKVLSPFPGLIKNILVADGAFVKKDQPIIVLEAMKMDNEITAPCDGKITLSVAKGATVETNATLAVIG